MSGGQYDADDPVRAALRRLIDQGLMSDVGIDHVVPPAIQNSWRRSIASKVDPSGHPRIEDIGSQEDLIREAAGRVMDRWYGSLTNTRATLLLGNAQGHIIWRRTIDARDRRTLDQVGAVEGSDFSEGSSGTNGLGTAIEGRQPILIRGSQHFLESLRDVACAAAPVIHPLTGRVTGSVSLTSPAQEANDFMVALVRQASQEISDALLEGSDSRDVALARAFRKARSGRNCQECRGVLRAGAGTAAVHHSRRPAATAGLLQPTPGGSRSGRGVAATPTGGRSGRLGVVVRDESCIGRGKPGTVGPGPGRV